MNAGNAITFDLAAVPREVRDDLARPLAIAVDSYFKQPGVEAAFQAWLVGYKKRKASKSARPQSGEEAQRNVET